MPDDAREALRRHRGGRCRRLPPQAAGCRCRRRVSAPVPPARPALPIVVLVADLDMALLRRAVDAGANGLCLKLDSIDEIESVLLRAATSSPPVWSRGALSLARRHAAQPRGASLTPKEQAVLERLVRGASTERIAESLGVGEATVRTHIQHLFTKFNVHSRLALVASAVRSDAVSVGDEMRFARSG